MAVKKKTARPKTARPKFKGRVTKADQMRALFRGLPQDQLADKKALDGLLKKHRISTTDSDIYRIRSEFLAGHPNATTSAASELKLNDLLAVKKLAEQVGGLPVLKNLILAIERIAQ